MQRLNCILVGAMCAVLVRAVVAADVGSVVQQVALPPDLVYLNRCAGGCPVSLGNDNAVMRTSSLVSGSVVVPEFAYSDDTFNAIAACTRAVLQPFNIRVTVFDPDTEPREEILLTTTGGAIGLPSNAGELAPFTGAREPNTLAFVFASLFSGDVDGTCWATATALGNLYGLDFVTPCADVMSFASGCGEKAFTNANSACDGNPEGTPGYCLSGTTTQNSFAKLSASVGPVDTVFSQGFESFEVPHAGPSP